MSDGLELLKPFLPGRSAWTRSQLLSLMLACTTAHQLRHAGRRGASLGGHLPRRGRRHCDGDSHDPNRRPPLCEEATLVKGYEAAGNRWLIEPIKRAAECEWD